MDPWKNGIALFCGIAIAQSFFLGVYILLKNKKPSMPIIFLSILLLSLALRIGKSIFFYLFPDIPIWGVAIGAAGLWAVGPSLWLYSKASKPSKITVWDFLHYIPSIAFLLIGSFMILPTLVTIYHTGSAIVMVYILAAGWLYKRENWEGNHKRFRLFWISLLIIGGTFIFQMWANTIEWYTFGSAVAAIVLYSINYFILNDKSILKPKKAKSNPQDPNQLGKIALRIDRLFREENIYRQKGLKVATVADSLQVPAYLVSKAINHQYSRKFNEFVNLYRVEEVKSHLEDLSTNLKVEVIATEVGFSSTASLYQAFKKEVEVTPQVYRKSRMEQ